MCFRSLPELLDLLDGRAVLVLTMVQMGICMGVSPLPAYNYGAKTSPGCGNIDACWQRPRQLGRGQNNEIS